MPLKHYNDFLEISPSFESVVDIDADSRNHNLWREYIVGEDMENLVDVLCQSLGNEAPDSRRSFWMHGSYGTGKSYAAIFVKHLLEEPADVVEEFLSKSARLSKYKNRFMKCRKKGDHLVIWKTGCTGIRSGDMMLLEAEQAIRDALVAKYGEKADLGGASLLSAVKSKLQDSSINWDFLIESTFLSEDYTSKEELTAAVDAGNIVAIQATAQVLRQKQIGLINNLDTFEGWVSEVIDANHLNESGIFFIWDEFTEYVSNSDDHTIMQQLSEFCKVKPFFMLYVVHRSDEMVDSMGKDRYQMITNRFHTVEFHITTAAALDLIAGSINIRNGMQNYWNDEREIVVDRIQKYLPDMTGLEDKTAEMIDKLCPIHPMTIRLLSRVAESFAAAQRTMFRFMKDQSDSEVGFVGYINQYGPDDEACWLTPEWLWDYFFTRDSDFSDKDTKVASYIQHYEDSLRLVEKDEDALRLFKIVMLLMAVSSTTKGAYGVRHVRGGISATQDCLENCVAGVISKEKVDSLLSTLEDSKLVLRDTAANGTIRLQLPFRGGSADAYQAKLDSNEKKYTRYYMFSRDGAFAQQLEKQAWDENDASIKRMKIAACSAETNSLTYRLDEVSKELEKSPYKLGLLIVTVKDDDQYNAVQSTISSRIANADPRLTIALLKDPLTEDIRKKWISSITRFELANEGGQTASANQFKNEANLIVTTWVSRVTSAGKLIAWNRDEKYTNQYGTGNLRSTIKARVLNSLFPYAPEHVVKVGTAYRVCNDSAPLAGITRKSTNSQLTGVLNNISPEVLLLNNIDDMVNATSDPAVSELARVIRDKMISGQRVSLSDLWEELQKPPFGYYNTIACGILLGIVFSCYKNSAYSWTDSAQTTSVLSEATLKTMVLNLCRGSMSTDYLSAGSVTFQAFRDYMKSIFGLSDDLVANETVCYQNMREAITKLGVPFWALKYLPDNSYGSNKEAAIDIIDGIQDFVSAEGEREPIMSRVIEGFNGRGKVRKTMESSLHDKNAMATAFQRFLYQSSSELEDIAASLAIKPTELNDRLQQSMQSAIYTWTELQVQDKLATIVDEYHYLIEVNSALDQEYHNLESAQRELANQLKYQCIPLAAVENADVPWYPALNAIKRLSQPGKAASMTVEERQTDAAALHEYGKFAKDFLFDSKSTLATILSTEDTEFTSEEISTIYSGLKGSTQFDMTLSAFNNQLNQQIQKIGHARNCAQLKAKWEQITGMSTVKAWCDAYNAPIFWVLPTQLQDPIRTVIDIKQGKKVIDQSVQDAINALDSEAAIILTDETKIAAAMRRTVSSDEQCRDYYDLHKPELLMQAKCKCKNDMSTWQTAELSVLQAMIRTAIKEENRKEKLSQAKDKISSIDDASLRATVRDFLDKHPEYCDDFLA